jgi:hypothetical protein
MYTKLQGTKDYRVMSFKTKKMYKTDMDSFLSNKEPNKPLQPTAFSGS